MDKEILKTDKIEVLLKKKEYRLNQNNLLFEIYKTMVKTVMPIEYNIFASKFIKFNDISESESFEILIKNIVRNQEM